MKYQYLIFYRRNGKEGRIVFNNWQDFEKWQEDELSRSLSNFEVLETWHALRMN